MELIKGDSAVDDRGKVAFVNDFDFKNVKRFYIVSNHQTGFIRAWHGHVKEAKYVFVSQGAAIVGVASLGGGEAKRFVLSADKPAVLYIPPGHANGFKTLTDDTQIMFFSTATLQESLADDLRLPANKWNIWEVEQR